MFALGPCQFYSCEEAGREVGERRTELVPTRLRRLPGELARGRAAQTHPGTARHPRKGPCLSPLLQGASPNVDSRAHLLDRNPGKRVFSKHARKLRTTALGRQGWEFRAGLCISLESTVLVKTLELH